MQSNPPQGINGRRGAHRRRGAPRGRGGPVGRGGPGGRGGPKGRAAASAPHSAQKNTATRENNVERDPSPLAPRSSPMDPRLKKCYRSQVYWDKCKEKGLIPKRVRFGTHYSRLNDYEAGTDPPTRAPRRHKVEGGPSHSQAKSLYISRLVIISSGNCVSTAYFEPKKIRTF